MIIYLAKLNIIFLKSFSINFEILNRKLNFMCSFSREQIKFPNRKCT